MRKLSTLATALFLGAALPLAAQSSYPLRSGEVMVQNNRDVPVTVYLEHQPLDLNIGTVEAMDIGTLSLPDWAVRNQDHVKLIVQPEGQLPLQADALIRSNGARFALMVPSSKGQKLDLSMTRMAAVVPAEYLDQATVTVKNDRKRAMDVFIQRGSMDVRLGRVEPYSTATFPVPEHWVGEMAQLLVVPIRSGTLPLASQDVRLEEGSHLGIHVE